MACAATCRDGTNTCSVLAQESVMLQVGHGVCSNLPGWNEHLQRPCAGKCHATGGPWRVQQLAGMERTPAASLRRKVSCYRWAMACAATCRDGTNTCSVLAQESVMLQVGRASEQLNVSASAGRCTEGERAKINRLGGG